MMKLGVLSTVISKMIRMTSLSNPQDGMLLSVVKLMRLLPLPLIKQKVVINMGR